jgi:predicted transcriptional regulator
MSLTATSIKIPRNLKAKIERLARNTGVRADEAMLRRPRPVSWRS